MKRRGRGALVERVSESPLRRLIRIGRLDIFEHEAADDIVFAYHSFAGLSSTRDADLGHVRGEFNPGGAEAAAVRRIDTLDKYREWRTDLAHTPALATALAVLIDETAPAGIDRLQRQRNGTAMAQLLAGLRHFAALRGNTPRGVKWRYKVESPFLPAIVHIRTNKGTRT